MGAMRREKVWCDRCGAEFVMEPVTKTDDLNGKKVWYSLITCPNCNKRFFSFLYSKALERKINHRKELLEGARGTRDLDEIQKLIDRADELRKEIYREHWALKKEFKKYMENRKNNDRL